MQLTDKVQLKGEKAGQILGIDEITVDGALGYAAIAVEAYELAKANSELLLKIAEKVGVTP